MKWVQGFLFSTLIGLLGSGATAQIPAISSVTPPGAQIGSSVTLAGVNFGATPAANIVFFGGVRANVTAASASSLTLTVPAGAAYAPITVTVGGLSGASGAAFAVTFASRQLIEPDSFAARVNLSSGHIPYAVALG